MCTDKIQLMVWASSEWPNGRRKGVAAAVVYLVKGVPYMKDNLEKGHFKASGN